MNNLEFVRQNIAQKGYLYVDFKPFGSLQYLSFAWADKIQLSFAQNVEGVVIMNDIDLNLSFTKYNRLDEILDAIDELGTSECYQLGIKIPDLKYMIEIAILTGKFEMHR